MSWRAITESDLETVLSAPEIAGIRDAALRAADPDATPPTTAQVDPIAPTITMVQDLVRGYIAASGRYILGAVGIPEKLIGPACDIAAYRIYSRVGTDPGPQRLKQHDDAIALLQSVAEGKYGLEEPTTESTEDTAGPLPSMHHKHRHFRNRHESGL